MKPSPLLIDVRAPKEFRKGHIPCAINVPLLDDEARACVGRTYKQKGRQEAIDVGFGMVGPVISSLAQEIESKRLEAGKSTILLYCHRGGLRSQLFAAYLQQEKQLPVSILNGGYKTYRREILDSFHNKQQRIIIIGGRTGSGKTAVLGELGQRGFQILDLEKAAQHSGSAFGRIMYRETGQATQEQFENDLGIDWIRFDEHLPVFIEDEGAHVGQVQVPNGLWKRMRDSTTPILDLQLNRTARIERLVLDYASNEIVQNPDWRSNMEKSILRIEKRLGHERLKTALQAFEKDSFHQVASVLLEYYDKQYDRHKQRNRKPNQFIPVPISSGDDKQVVQSVLNVVVSSLGLSLDH